MDMLRVKRPIDPEARYLSPRQAARLLGVAESIVYQGVRRDEIPHRKLGKRILIPRDWVEAK